MELVLLLSIVNKTNDYSLIEKSLGSFDKLIRLFRLQGVRMLINDIYIRVYPGYQFLILIKNGDYVSYITKEGLERCHREGAEMFESEKFFADYINEVSLHIKNCHAFAKTLIEDAELRKESIETFFDYCVTSLKLYKYTDFNFSDGAHQRAQELNDQKVFDRLEEFGRFKNEMREFLNDLFVKDTSYLEMILMKISAKYDVPILSLKEYAYLEIIDLVANGTPIEKNVISERIQASGIYNDNGTILYIRGAEAEELFDTLIAKEDVQQITTIKGTCASKGLVRGYARVISADYDDFQKLFTLFEEMKQGEILISETTSPDLMPACKKAAAIVTNQGGMISHAAIISREFGIPCVVGTQNATKIIKNGDYIEVDANKGIVTIIETE